MSNELEFQEILQSVANSTISIDNLSGLPDLETAPKKEKKKDEIVEIRKQDDPPKMAKKKKPATETKSVIEKDGDFTTAAIRREYLRLIKMVFHDKNAKEALDHVLKEWLQKNRKKIDARHNELLELLESYKQ